jgi:hypothetical protein
MDPLSLVAVETERHVAAAGWDQNPRVFALVPTAELLEREPRLRDHLAEAGPAGLVDGALTAIEQDGLPRSTSLESLLGRMAWPETVAGAAIAVERIVVPPAAEHDLPANPAAAIEALSAHPGRRDVRLLVAVLRGGQSRCLVRQRDHDRDDQVASGPELVPGLVHALRATLED